jgi:hypothetical protein
MQSKMNEAGTLKATTVGELANNRNGEHHLGHSQFFRSRNAVILIAACLFFGGYAANQAMSSDPQSGRAALAEPASARPVNSPASLIIYRPPNLGFDLVVNLWLDGTPFGLIVYGQTYVGFLPRGRHVLSATVSPNPKWPGFETKIALNVRDGQIYTFTAIGNSGQLILKALGGQERPAAGTDKKS